VTPDPKANKVREVLEARRVTRAIRVIPLSVLRVRLARLVPKARRVTRVTQVLRASPASKESKVLWVIPDLKAHKGSQELEVSKDQQGSPSLASRENVAYRAREAPRETQDPLAKTDVTEETVNVESLALKVLGVTQASLPQR
jgi:hypothetical protein